MDMVRERLEADEVGEWLDGALQPWDRRYGEWVLHRGTGAERRYGCLLRAAGPEQGRCAGGSRS